MSGWWVVADNSGNLSVVPDPPPAGYNKLPGWLGVPFPTKAEAQQALKAEQQNIATQVPNTGNPWTSLIPGHPNSIPNPINAIPNPLTGISAVGDFFQRLTQKNTWIRIGEVVLGLILIVAGVSKIAGVSTPLPV